MTFQAKLMRNLVVAMTLVVGNGWAIADGGSDDASYCMDVDIQPFHMLPGYASELGACAVKDYWGGELQDAFYPFTKQDHLFNCDYFGDLVPLPLGKVPSSVVSEGMITGTIGGHPFEAKLFCASLTNWYQDSCADPEDPNTCSVQLAQPFLSMGLPFPRVTEVSIFDGTVTVARGKKERDIPIVMATRAAGITHIESLAPFPDGPQVGASVTHSLLGMVTHGGEDGDKVRVLDGSLDLLLQGHIFFPGPVEDDVDPDTGKNEAAVVKGAICSKDLYKLLNKRGKGGKGGHDHDDDDDDD